MWLPPPLKSKLTSHKINILVKIKGIEGYPVITRFKFSNKKSQLQINAIGFFIICFFSYINVLIDINIKSAAPKK